MQAFSSKDPLGLGLTCSSVISVCSLFVNDSIIVLCAVAIILNMLYLFQGVYERVGILLPQFMNAPKTCAMAGRFAFCFPPATPGNKM